MTRRLRIVHVVRSDSFAGVERSIVLSARALSDRGHDVTVVGGHPQLMALHLDGTRIVHLPAASVSQGVRALRRLGAMDVVHAHMTAGEMAAVLSRPFHRAAVVATRHFALRRGTSLPGRLAGQVIKRCRVEQIAISNYVALNVEGPSTVLHHGLPSAEAVNMRSPVVLVAQRLEREKETAAALQAFASSGLAELGWKLVIAGDGSERLKLQSLSDELGIAAGVEFLGRVDDVDALRRNAALQLASPSTEHFGLSVLEAMAVGLTVVAADGGAHRELLGASYPALYSSGDALRAGELVRELALDGVGRQSLGRQLQERQRAEFSLQRHADGLEAVYLTAINGNLGS